MIDSLIISPLLLFKPSQVKSTHSVSSFEGLYDSTALACHSAKINVNIIVNINFYTIIVNITQMVYL